MWRGPLILCPILHLFCERTFGFGPGSSTYTESWQIFINYNVRRRSMDACPLLPTSLSLLPFGLHLKKTWIVTKKINILHHYVDP